MDENIDHLSSWIRNQESIPSSLTDLAEEVHQTGLETDFLLQASGQLQSAYASLLNKLDR